MTADRPHAHRHGHWATTALLAIGTASAYTALRRDLAHGSDIFTLSRWLDEPGFVHPHHPLYLPVANALRWLLQPLGLERMALFALYSALGAALGCAALHRAALCLRGDPLLARHVALAAALVPAVTYFATLGELHAPFFGCAALGWWAWARWATQPTPWRALGCGATVGLATLFHATGAALGPWFVGAYLWRQRAAGRRTSAQLVTLCAVAAALVWATGFFGLRGLGQAPAGQPIEHVAERFDPVATLQALPGTWLADWLWPFAPASLLALLAFVRGRGVPALLLHLAVLAHVAFTATMLRGGGHEFGAYDLPLVFPALVLAADALPRRWWFALPLGALLASGLHRAAYPRLRPDLALGRAAVALVAAAPTVFLVGDEAETQGIRWYAPRAELIEAWVFQVQLGAGAKDFTAEQVRGWLQWQLGAAQQAGRRLFITDRAVHNLGQWLPEFDAGFAQFAATVGGERPTLAGANGRFLAPR
ncbi:MAG: hypothetical protein JNK49_16020 [Planctomycetes bacterium]|nr:hypothetical protein [Planctomycetota bacterium]